MNSPPSGNVLVCVTDQPSCERLIRAGAVVAKEQNVPVRVVSILPEGLVSKHTAAVLQSLYDTASALGAQMTFYFNSAPALTTAVHARQIGSSHIVCGAPGERGGAFIETIHGLLPDLPISIVDTENRMATMPAMPAGVRSPQ